MRNMKIIIGLLTLIGVLLTPVTLISGEDEKETKIGRLYRVTGDGPEFMDALTKHIEWRRKNKDPWAWWAWEEVNGDNLGTIYFYSGDHSWADLDAYEEFKGGEHFQATVLPHVAEITSIIDMSDESISHWHPEPEKVQYISVIDFHLKPGKHADFKKVVDQYHKVLRENDHPGYYGFNWTLNGGSGGIVTLLLPYESWADMQEPEETMQELLYRVLGKEEAMKLDQDFAKTFSSSQSCIVKFIPELSVMPKE